MQIRPEDIVNTGNLELLARKAVEGFITGLHKSPFHGFSVEFAEHRQYNQGESTKNIDWKLYGRTDKLYNKRFDEETNLRCQFLIDVSPSMQLTERDGMSKLQFAAWSTAVISNLLKRQRDASGLCFFDNEVREYTKMASSGRHYRELTGITQRYIDGDFAKGEGTDIAATLHTVAGQIHRRSMIILFTDFWEKGRDLEALFTAIKHLKHNKHEVIVFHTLNHSKELEFDYGNRPTTFIDAETGQELKIQPADVKEKYKEDSQAYIAKIKAKLTQYRIDYIEADTARSVQKVLIPFLLKRRRMSR